MATVAVPAAARSERLQDFLDYWCIEKGRTGRFGNKPTAVGISPTDLKLRYLNGELEPDHWFAKHMKQYGAVV